MVGLSNCGEMVLATVLGAERSRTGAERLGGSCESLGRRFFRNDCVAIIMRIGNTNTTKTTVVASKTSASGLGNNWRSTMSVMVKTNSTPDTTRK